MTGDWIETEFSNSKRDGCLIVLTAISFALLLIGIGIGIGYWLWY